MLDTFREVIPTAASEVAVAAIDADIAREAVDLIEVEYEPLPGVFDPEEALLYLDGRFIGSADDFDGHPDYLYLEPGVYELEESARSGIGLPIIRARSFEFTADLELGIRELAALLYGDEVWVEVSRVLSS